MGACVCWLCIVKGFAPFVGVVVRGFWEAYIQGGGLYPGGRVVSGIKKNVLKCVNRKLL